MSVRKAWKRVCEKLSPSTKVQMSPIKHICYHCVLDPIVIERYTEAHIWTLLNTEEFYYQETCSLVYHNFESRKGLLKLLKNTRIIINWGERLEGYELLGTGCFGEVYKAQDSITGQYFALKRIVQGEELEEEAESFISNILLEKSTLSELNKCPFFIGMVGAFQDTTKTSYWFVMEYCICDLSKLLVNYPPHDDNDSLWHDYMNDMAMENVDEYLSEMYHINYKETIFLYFFEMLCALYYLARRHIRHADLKTENILISTTGHIKVGDFGVSFRDNWFYRNSLTIIANSEEDKEEIDALDYSYNYKGNTMHYDPETTINNLKLDSLKFGMMLDKRYSHNKYYNELRYYHQSFISDLYAVGLITSELLFGGLVLKQNPETHNRRLRPFWNIDIVYDDTTNIQFIKERFFNSSRDEKTESIMTFLYSIFLPRKIRAKGYLSKKKVFYGSHVKTESYININKVENILYYSSNSINHLNVLSRRFPHYFMNKLSSKSESVSNEAEMQNIAKDSRSVFNLVGFGFTDTKYFK